MLKPEQYFPCFNATEQGAVRLVYASFVPLYFVVPTAPIDDYFAAAANNFSSRQTLFEGMFRVVREEVTIPPLEDPIEVYIGFYEFYLSWILYNPIAFGSDPAPCRVGTYSDV